MKLIRDPEKLQREFQKVREREKSIGFVPTMGALHEGHLSLVRTSKRDNDLTVVSIFVNPAQFGPQEDLDRYPRPIRRDLGFLRAAKVDFVFVPSARAMYPEGLVRPLRIKNAKWPRLAKGLCGKFRPGHFQGVVTIVAKLLDRVRPSRLYVGAKDYQQARVLSQLVSDLGMGVKVCVMPTVREKDGLAMSSRNRYLSKPDRLRARMFSRVLFQLRSDLKKNKASITTLKAQALRKLKPYVDRVQYLEIADPVTLRSLKRSQKKMIALGACFVGKTRLIDNVTIQINR